MLQHPQPKETAARDLVACAMDCSFATDQVTCQLVFLIRLRGTRITQHKSGHHWDKTEPCTREFHFPVLQLYVPNHTMQTKSLEPWWYPDLPTGLNPGAPSFTTGTRQNFGTNQAFTVDQFLRKDSSIMLVDLSCSHKETHYGWLLERTASSKG